VWLRIYTISEQSNINHRFDPMHLMYENSMMYGQQVSTRNDERRSPLAVSGDLHADTLPPA